MHFLIKPDSIAKISFASLLSSSTSSFLQYFNFRDISICESISTKDDLAISKNLFFSIPDLRDAPSDKLERIEVEARRS